MSEQVKTPYKLSKDYIKLFNLISQEYEIPCWIDYDFTISGEKIISRDICSCKRWREWSIRFSARGIGYASVDKYMKKETDLSEMEFFVKLCESQNVEYIESI